MEDEKKALSYAVYALSRRMLSEFELKKKLLNKGYSQETVDAALLRLKGLKALDDTEYAKTLVRNLNVRGYGKRRILDEMRKRGVGIDAVDVALEEECLKSDGMKRFIDKRLKGRNPDDKELRRVYNALLRRGFSYAEVKDGLKEYSVTLEECLDNGD